MTTYYVDGAVGSDSNAGTSEGAGNAWLTIGKGASTVAAGDTVNVKATGNYVENVTLVTPGAIGTPILWQGYTSTVGDEGVVTIAPSVAGYCVTGSGEFFQVWRNFRFTGASNAGYFDSSADNLTFDNCEFDTNGTKGFQSDNNVGFLRCSFHGNTTVGAEADDGTMFYACVFYANGGNGNAHIESGQAIKCLFYGLAAGDDQLQVNDLQARPTLYVMNTFDGENAATTTALDINGVNAVQSYIVDNIIYDHASGIDLATDNLGSGQIGWNLLNSNTTDETNVTGSINNQTTAPAFTNEGTDDYTLGATSDAIDNGLVNPGT